MPLCNHSCYSLKYGIQKPKELIQQAIAYGYTSIALTDINNTSGCLDFMRLSEEKSLHSVIGIDFRNTIEQLYIGLAKSNEGFRHAIPAIAPVFTEAYIIYPMNKSPDRKLHDNEFIGVKLSQLNRFKMKPKEVRDKAVALQIGSFRSSTEYQMHKLLRAIDLNSIYTKITPQDYASQEDIFLKKEDYERAYQEYEDLLLRTEQLLESCQVSFDFKKRSSRSS